MRSTWGAPWSTRFRQRDENFLFCPKRVPGTALEPKTAAFTTSSSSSGPPREGPGRGELSLASLQERFQKCSLLTGRVLSHPSVPTPPLPPLPGAPQNLRAFQKGNYGVFKLQFEPFNPKKIIPFPVYMKSCHSTPCMLQTPSAATHQNKVIFYSLSQRS